MGAFSLMRIPQVKQALLTFLARHPNMQLNEKHMLFEETGVCSDMARMKAAVDDLAYLGQTLEAGYNDLAGSQAAPAKPQTRTRTRSKGVLPVAQLPVVVPANPAAAAEILQTRSDAVAGAARAAHRQHTANVKAASELDRRDAEATVAEFDRQRAAREAEHDRKMNEIRAERERRVAEMQDDEGATASAVARACMSCVFSNRAIVTGSSCERTPRRAFCISKPLSDRSAASCRESTVDMIEWVCSTAPMLASCRYSAVCRAVSAEGFSPASTATPSKSQSIRSSASSVDLSLPDCVIRQCRASVRSEKLPAVARHHSRLPNRRPTRQSAAACSAGIDGAA
jgi:hypothetical protein